MWDKVPTLAVGHLIRRITTVLRLLQVVNPLLPHRLSHTVNVVTSYLSTSRKDVVSYSNTVSIALSLDRDNNDIFRIQ